jgi:hypothetical protein
VVLDEAVSGGPWSATITIRSGLLERRAQARLTFPDRLDVLAAPMRAQVAQPLPYAEDPRIVVPIAAGLVGLLALLLVVAALVGARHRARPA